MKSAKLSRSLLLFMAVSVLCACSTNQPKPMAATPMVPPKPITIPVGKNWQVIEEAPQLSDERGRVPFQTEQSIQPPGAPPVTPTDVRKLETPR
jgi:hypothetical protein